jgi:hypothetical protein
VFSTYLYTGNGSTQTITNGLSLSTSGGLVWIKCRNSSTPYNLLVDSARGNTKVLYSNAGSDQYSEAGLTTLTSSGFSVGQVSTPVLNVNASSETYASWSFKKQAKFFDVVTYTGNGGTNLISHNLGSAPGCVIVKKFSNSSDWGMWHRGNGGSTDDTGLSLNTTGAAALPNVGIAASFTSTTWPAGFVYTSAGANMNDSGATYVAYLFAHNAGGFGLTGTDNVISCGAYTETSAATLSVNLGYEPQVLLIKPVSTTGNWNFIDNMRGFSQTQNTMLFPNTSGIENTYSAYWKPTATGFNADNVFGEGTVYIYIAIRRGPMKVPTLGTSVFAPVARAGTGANATITGGFAPDLIVAQTSNLGYGAAWWDRLRGPSVQIRSYTTAAEMFSTDSVKSYTNTGVTVGEDGNEWINGVASGNMYANWIFQRAPSFFDEVCYTGDGVDTRMLNHNLNAQPELIISKNRQGVQNWQVIKFAPAVTTTSGTNYWIQSISTAGSVYDGTINSTFGPSYSAPTSTQYPVGIVSGNTNAVNASGITYVAYLFATCAGVSKVGSYTGTGTTLQVNCGFTGGARFILIKRTDSTGDWYVWDTARGIVSGNDPYLLLNTQSAQVTSTDYIDTYSAGFEISSTAPAAINASGGSFIFFAVS